MAAPEGGHGRVMEDFGSSPSGSPEPFFTMPNTSQSFAAGVEEMRGGRGEKKHTKGNKQKEMKARRKGLGNRQRELGQGGELDRIGVPSFHNLVTMQAIFFLELFSVQIVPQL